ncbi:GNAT family N-acetyltransferase [Tepidimonas taiwanensis]|uniref:GNAT family N-acetyltransferase n=1 Tax=Tepidimonas taiwanensis TaxID=307486 RepID=UPI0005B96B1E|nr:GNAT family N-acetyltransferase [Tepidimonas taiwanensis]
MNSEHTSLWVRRFEAQDFPVYRQWYADPLLDQHLGPMDDDWLAHVMADPVGEQWALGKAQALVAVIGLVPEPEHGAWLISDFAVDPSQRGRGWGRRARQALLAQPAMHARRHWRAYVAEDNPGAQAFFDALGWTRQSAPSPEDPFWTYAWRR